MKFSPLQLLHSHFIALSIVARDDLQPEQITSAASASYPKVGEEDLNTEVQLGTPDDPDPHQFVVKLGVSCAPNKDSILPYRFAVKMEGVFNIAHSGEIEERKRMVVVNGAAMLYGALREQVHTITNRHKYGSLLLPSLDFRTLGAPPEPESKTKKPASKAKVTKSSAKTAKKT